MRSVVCALAVVLLLAGCENSLTSSGDGATYLESRVAVVKYVNASQRSGTYVELETELGNLLLVVTSTEVYMQAGDFSGFDRSGVAPDLRYGTILQPGQTVEYYYEMGNVNYAAPKDEYVLSRIYVYQLSCPDLPAVTED